MRIAIGQLWQETNTFNRNPTQWSDFENWGVAVGPDVVARYGETNEIGGFTSECRAWDPGIELVGLARFLCWPWGRVEAAAWRRIQETFERSLAAAGKVDAVVLSLHGAMSAEGEDDVTGALLAQVRQIIGPDVPLVGSLDLHANITRRMMDAADLLVGYHACPHIDQKETGQRAVRGLRRMLDLDRRPTKYWRKLPMFTAAESQNTFTGPAAPIYRRLEALERDPGVLSAGLYMSMPWLDVPALGWTVMLHSHEPRPEWEREVSQLAERSWGLRQAMSDIERFGPAEVVAKAKAHGGHPIVIGDGADATNSGSPGDNTVLLREFLKQQPIPHGALTFLVDPEAVAQAQRVGPGGEFDALVGAAFAPEYSEPLRFRGTVEKLLDVRFILSGHGGNNTPINMGRGAVVRSGDVTVLFTEKNGPGSSPLLYEAAGLNPRTCGIVVAKSPAGFRGDYDPFVAAAYLADCPGPATAVFSRLKFEHVTHPLWPLDGIETPHQAGWC